MKGLTEAEIAEDIHGEPVTPIGHVLRGAPALLLVRASAQVTDGVAKGADIA